MTTATTMNDAMMDGELHCAIQYYQNNLWSLAASSSTLEVTNNSNDNTNNNDTNETSLVESNENDIKKKTTKKKKINTTTKVLSLHQEEKKNDEDNDARSSNQPTTTEQQSASNHSSNSNDSNENTTTMSRVQMDELWEQYKGIEQRPCPSVSFEEVFLLRDNWNNNDDDDNDENDENNNNCVIIDTRTPKEFAEAHVYGAHNIPLLNDYQRHVVGKTYHDQSKHDAIQIGWELFSPQIYDFLQCFEPYRNNNNKNTNTKIYIYCWRGGMRSRTVTNLLLLNGYTQVYQVQGGYKRYLNDVVWKGLERFANDGYQPQFIVLFGNTGTRKTQVLQELKKKKKQRQRQHKHKQLPVIDLEDLAGHMGSVYGGVVQQQPKSQKQFSILLYHALDEYKDEPLVLIEGEAHKIGNVHLPQFVHSKINHDVRKILVKASLATRVTCISNDYLVSDDSIARLKAVTRDNISLQRNIGPTKLQQLQQWLDDGEFKTAIEWLLIEYYDQRYIYNKKSHNYVKTVCSDDLQQCCQDLIDYYHDEKQKIMLMTTNHNNDTHDDNSATTTTATTATTTTASTRSLDLNSTSSSSSTSATTTYWWKKQQWFIVLPAVAMTVAVVGVGAMTLLRSSRRNK